MALLAACGDDGQAEDATLEPPTPAETRIYLIFDQPPGGPFLLPVSRPGVAAEPEAVLDALIEGTTAEEREIFPMLSSAAPPGIGFTHLVVEDGVATIEFSGSPLEEMDRHAWEAQVVYTLTSLDAVDAVAMVSSGQTLEPRGRGDYTDLLPPIYIDVPGFDEPAGNPATVAGSATAGIEEITLVVVNEAGRVIFDEQFQLMAEAGPDSRTPFVVEVPYEVSSEQVGLLLTWHEGASGEEALRQHRVVLIPD